MEVSSALRFRFWLVPVVGFACAYACSDDSTKAPVLSLDGGSLAPIDATATIDAFANADGAASGDDAGTTDASDANAAESATPDAEADAAPDACAAGTVLACDLDAGTELRCAGDGGNETVPCVEGCDPDAGRCFAPLAVDAGPDPIVALDASTTLTAVATGGVGPYTYAWSPITGLDDAASPQPIVSPSSTTPYTVTVTDVHAHTASDMVLVKVPDAPLTLSRWTVVNYAAAQTIASWSFLSDGTTAVQSVNADPSLLVSDFELSAFEVTGRFAVTNAAGDNDFIGFAFGYQDPRHYYLFDWKAGAQVDATCGSAARGMTLRRIETDADPTCQVLWSTAGGDGGATTLSPASLNDVSWVAGTTYDFKLSHSAAGLITIDVRNASNQAVVGSVSATDTTWLKGKFAFYNYSQANARYEFFRVKDL